MGCQMLDVGDEARACRPTNVCNGKASVPCICLYAREGFLWAIRTTVAPTRTHNTRNVVGRRFPSFEASGVEPSPPRNYTICYHLMTRCRHPYFPKPDPPAREDGCEIGGVSDRRSYGGFRSNVVGVDSPYYLFVLHGVLSLHSQRWSRWKRGQSSDGCSAGQGPRT